MFGYFFFFLMVAQCLLSFFNPHSRQLGGIGHGIHLEIYSTGSVCLAIHGKEITCAGTTAIYLVVSFSPVASTKDIASASYLKKPAANNSAKHTETFDD